MPNPDDPDLEIPELTAEWFRTAVRPLRRGKKRAVFLDESLADRFASDAELEQALRAFLDAAEHIRRRTA